MTLRSVQKKYKRITEKLVDKNISITTMESCTSGFIASLITDTPGASCIMKGALVTYSNEAKIKYGVNEETINRYGVYSNETAFEMARVCRKTFNADIGVGVTGSFQNTDPANSDSVIGFVYISLNWNKQAFAMPIKVPKFKTRFEYKLYVANKIADELLQII